MRPLSASAMAIMACALTSVVAVAQTRPATPARPNRAAQPAPANPDGQPPMRRAGPMGPGRGTPADQMLRMRQQLQLTDDQVTKLEALRSAPRPEVNAADMLRARADLMDATKGDVNTDKARAAFDRMAKIRTDVQIAQLRARQDARNVLTPAQRTRMDSFVGNRRAGRGAAMRGRAGARSPQRAGAPRGMRRGDQFGPPGPMRLRGAPGPQGMGVPQGPDGPRRNRMGLGEPFGPGRRDMMAPRGPRPDLPPAPPADPVAVPPGDR